MLAAFIYSNMMGVFHFSSEKSQPKSQAQSSPTQESVQTQLIAEDLRAPNISSLDLMQANTLTPKPLDLPDWLACSNQSFIITMIQYWSNNT